MKRDNKQTTYPRGNASRLAGIYLCLASSERRMLNRACSASYLSPTTIYNPAQYCFSICVFQHLYSLVPLREYILKTEKLGQAATLLKPILFKLAHKESISKEDLDKALVPYGFDGSVPGSHTVVFNKYFESIMNEEPAEISDLFHIKYAKGTPIYEIPKAPVGLNAIDFESVTKADCGTQIVTQWPVILHFHVHTGGRAGQTAFSTSFQTHAITPYLEQNYTYHLLAIRYSDGHAVIWFRQNLLQLADEWIVYSDSSVSRGQKLMNISATPEKVYVFVRDDYIPTMIGSEKIKEDSVSLVDEVTAVEPSIENPTIEDQHLDSIENQHFDTKGNQHLDLLQTVDSITYSDGLADIKDSSKTQTGSAVGLNFPFHTLLIFSSVLLLFY